MHDSETWGPCEMTTWGGIYHIRWISFDLCRFSLFWVTHSWYRGRQLMHVDSIGSWKPCLFISSMIKMDTKIARYLIEIWKFYDTPSIFLTVIPWNCLIFFPLSNKDMLPACFASVTWRGCSREHCSAELDGLNSGSLWLGYCTRGRL